MYTPRTVKCSEVRRKCAGRMGYRSRAWWRTAWAPGVVMSARDRGMFLCICLLLSFGAACAADSDSGIRITAPMDGWALPHDLPVQLAYFAIWPPCSARPTEECAGSADTCPRKPTQTSASGADTKCQTRVTLNGHHISSHQLTDNNEYSYSGLLPVDALTPGEYKLSVLFECKGARARLLTGATSTFSVVDSSVWEELGDDGEDEGGGRQTPAPSRFLAQFPHLDAPQEAVPSDAQTAKHAGFRTPSSTSLKCAVMLYHTDVLKAYDARWINKSILSILAQTHQDFDIYELNYGDKDSSTYSAMQPHLHLLQGKHYTFLSQPLSSHAAAMNLLLDRIFADGYDVAFNVNIDDYYAPSRFARQLEAIEQGADLVSSEFVRITAAGSDRDVIHLDYQPTYLNTAELFGDAVLGKLNAQGAPQAEMEDVQAQLAADHNVLCHPGIALTRRFWEALAALRCIGPAAVAAADHDEVREHAARHTAHRSKPQTPNPKPQTPNPKPHRIHTMRRGS
jgi:hypothetical protein